MSAESFEKVQDLFESALLLDESQREQFLASKCGKNKKLHKEIHSLLYAQKQVEQVFPKVGNGYLHLAQSDSAYNLVGPYQIIKTLGSGGMGVVYKAFDVRLERYVALKFLPSTLCDDPQAKKRLIREAKSASALDHQNICTIYDICDYNQDQLYIAMAYYEGESLEYYLKHEKLSIEKALDIVDQLLDGLLTAHRKGIYHRDIKPANLLVTTEGKLKIVDFGIAITKNNTSTDTGVQAGSASYMSPEQIRGEKSDAQSDLWGTAVILYELLSGQRAFSGETLPQIVNRVLNEEPAPISQIRADIPPAVDKWLSRALAKKEKNRFANTETFSAEFQNLKSGLTTLLSVKKSIAEKSNRGMSEKPMKPATKPNPKLSVFAIGCAIELSNYMDLSDDIDDESFKNLISAYIQTLETIITEYRGSVHALQGDTFIVKFPIDQFSDADAARHAAVEACLSIQTHVKGLSELHGEALHCRMALDSILSEDTKDIDNAIEHMSGMLKVANENKIFIDASLKSQLEPTFEVQKIESDVVSDEYSQLWEVCGLNSSVPATEETEESKESASELSLSIDPNAVNQQIQGEAMNDQGVLDRVSNANVAPIQATADQYNEAVTECFVGRLNEQDRIRKIMQQCIATKKLHVNVISGDTGIGCNYFARKTATLAENQDFISYTVSHYELGVSEDVLPLNLLVKKILIDLHPQKRSAEHSLVSNALQINCIEPSQVPALHDLLGLSLSKKDTRKYSMLSHGNRQKLLAETIISILKYAASKSPLLINILDIHLARSETLSILAMVLQQTLLTPIIINVTSLKNAAKLNHFLHKCPQNLYRNNFDLDPLSTAESGQLIGKSGGDVNQLELYMQLTQGNPLHISLLALAKAVNDEASSLEESIDAIVSALQENDRLAIRAASVLGSCFSLEALRYLLSNPDYKISALVEAGLITPNGRYYQFKHSLVRDLIYAVLNQNSLQNFHTRAAEWYAYVDESIRAHHLQMAQSDEAFQSCLSAAKENYSYCHYETTVRLCGKALAIASSANDIAKCSVVLGNAYVKLDKTELAAEHFKSVLAQSNSERLQCMATLGMAETCIANKEFQKATNLLEEAKYLVKDGGFTSLEPRLSELADALALKKIEY